MIKIYDKKFPRDHIKVTRLKDKVRIRATVCDCGNVFDISNDKLKELLGD